MLTSTSLCLPLLAAFSLLGVVQGVPALVRRDGTTSTVDLGNNTGAPAQLASGTLYGLPNHTHQIPDKFFTDIGWDYERSGGAQIPAPGRGWIWGLSEYKVSSNSLFTIKSMDTY